MSFKSILGHERPIQILKATLRQNCLAHAYLFYGPEGIGKRLVAKAFAKTVNCSGQSPLASDQEPDTGGQKFTTGNWKLDTGHYDSCGQCNSCVQIEAETHPDFTSVEPDGTMIKIAQIRTLQEQMQLKPLAGLYRFVIFEEAHLMNDEAANALLKSLEEPPSQTILILITSQPHSLLATVVSRCQKIGFTTLTDQQVLQLLKQKRAGDSSQFDRVAALAMGSIGVALELDPKGLETAWLQLGQVLLDASPSKVSNLLDFAQEYAQDRQTTERTLLWVGLWLRELLRTKIQSKVPSILPISFSSEFLKAATRLSIEEIRAFAGLIHWIRRAMTRNINKQLVLEVLLLQLRNTINRTS